MADVLRATRAVPGFHEAAEIHLVEASPMLRDVQRAKISDDVTWHDTIDTLPDGPLFLLANEFFDALPIRQFQRDGTGWRERVVGVHGDGLSFGLTAPVPLADLAHRQDDTQDGDLVETCPALPAIIAQIGARIGTSGGAALIVDYGDWRSLGDTFQALHDHQRVDPLTNPGQADLTAHVDFEAIARNAGPARYTRLTPQGVFLERLGVTERAQQLAKGLSGAALDSHIVAHRRLTHPDEMGHLFKVIGLYPDGAPPPPGLEP
jgi:SAM-dependent MidA family methyltransferase